MQQCHRQARTIHTSAQASPYKHSRKRIVFLDHVSCGSFAQARKQVFAFIHECIHANIQAYIPTYKHTCIHAGMHIYLIAYSNMHADVHACMHGNTYTCSLAWCPLLMDSKAVSDLQPFLTTIKATVNGPGNAAHIAFSKRAYALNC